MEPKCDAKGTAVWCHNYVKAVVIAADIKGWFRPENIYPLTGGRRGRVGGAQACKALQVIAVYKIKEERKKRGKTATFLCSDTKSSYEIRLIKGVLWRRPFFPTSREPCLWALLIAFMWQVIFLHLRRSPNNSTWRGGGGGGGGLGFSGTLLVRRRSRRSEPSRSQK